MVFKFKEGFTEIEVLAYFTLGIFPRAGLLRWSPHVEVNFSNSLPRQHSLIVFRNYNNSIL
jgi:hypothetical protein